MFGGGEIMCRYANVPISQCEATKEHKELWLYTERQATDSTD